MQFLSTLRTWSVNSLMLVGVLLATLGITEYGLALLGFPDRIPLRVAHPPDYSEARKSGEFEYTFSTNNQGLRYRNLPLENNTGEFRVFVVGDSFAEGVGVTDGERFTDLLEQDSQRSGTPMQFINGGLAGTGPLEHGRMYLHVGRKYQPDALLITVYANDVTNTFAYLKKEWLYGDMSRDEDSTGNNHLLEKVFPRLLALMFTATERSAIITARTALNFRKQLETEARAHRLPRDTIDTLMAAIPPGLVTDVDRGGYSTSQYWEMQSLIRITGRIRSISTQTLLKKMAWRQYPVNLKHLSGQT